MHHPISSKPHGMFTILSKVLVKYNQCFLFVNSMTDVQFLYPLNQLWHLSACPLSYTFSSAAFMTPPTPLLPFVPITSLAASPLPAPAFSHWSLPPLIVLSPLGSLQERNDSPHGSKPYVCTCRWHASCHFRYYLLYSSPPGHSTVVSEIT